MKTQAFFHPFDVFGHAGTRQGPELLADAVQEMLHDNRRETTPTRSRAYTKKIHVDEFVFDAPGDYEDWRGAARAAIAATLDTSDFLLWSTGNHLGALPLYDVLAEAPATTLVIQFDAHLDIYNLADSTTELSHGNFLRHVAKPLPKIINLGHREQVLLPSEISTFFTHTIPATDLHRDPSAALDRLRTACGLAERVIIDLDCDVFDPTYFPAVAQPEPFGLTPAFVLTCLQEIWSPKVRGIAISEFFPARDERDRSLATLLWLIEWIFLKNHERI